MDIVTIITIAAAGAMGWTYRQVTQRRPDLRKPARVALGLGLAVLLGVVAVRSFEEDFGDRSSSAGPVIESGRIERPEDGFTVTFPEYWTVHDVAQEAMVEAASGTEAIKRDLPTVTVMGFPPDGGACGVYDITRSVHAADWASLDEVVVGSAANNEAWGWTVSGSDFVDLPAGRTGHIEATDVEGSHFDKYYFTDREAWFLLNCNASDPPNDSWLSIAETFEFLPDGE